MTNNVTITIYMGTGFGLGTATIKCENNKMAMDKMAMYDKNIIEKKNSMHVEKIVVKYASGKTYTKRYYPM